MNMQLHSHRQKQRRHASTKFIELDTHLCQACWECLDVCPTQVFGKVAIFNHRHARIDAPEACNGCKKCVRVCAYEAIRYTYIPPRRELEIDPPS